MIGLLLELDVGVVAAFKLLLEPNCLGPLLIVLAFCVCISFSTSGGDGEDLSLPFRMDVLGDFGDLNESSWLLFDPALFLLSKRGEDELAGG